MYDLFKGLSNHIPSLVLVLAKFRDYLRDSPESFPGIFSFRTPTIGTIDGCAEVVYSDH